MELFFGAITSAGVLYALLSPYFRKHSRKRKIKQIIEQEMDGNHESIAHWLFKDGSENVDESDITIGDLLLCSIELRETSWKMLKNEARVLFSPRVFVTIDAYYYQVESIIEIASRLKSQGLADDERKKRLKEQISSLEFEYVFCVAIAIIRDATEGYQRMLKKDREVKFKPMVIINKQEMITAEE
jgi:hypothetical protein